MAELYNRAVQTFTGAGQEWTSAGRDYRMLLLKEDASLTFTASHATVADVLAVAGNTECTDGSYARQTIASGNRTITNTGRKSQAHIDAAVDFGAITNENVGGALLYEHIDGTDANDLPVAWVTSTDFPIQTNGAGFTIDDGVDGLFEIEGVAAA